MSSNRAPSGPAADQGRDGGAPRNPSAEPAEAPAATARRVLRTVDRAALATAMREGAGDAGWPYPSLVLTALDHDATPLLLLSALAEHTANLAADPRVGLLFDGTAGLAQPLAGPRVGVLGRAERSGEPRHRARIRARHPGTALYMDFADFAVYRVAVERAHLVAGFGRVHWIDGADLLLGAAVPGFAAVEAALLDGPDGDAWAGGWTPTGIDPEGVDLRRDAAVARVAFDRPVADLAAARAALAQARRAAPP
ncbi:HugZ family protein [Azospirillum sp. ST 5-10]|uniref:HugZ family pyridoxamine 5'-phosphate oxidase n=1 Tax=unclassified Azospirillum TaxID=2630922 RepID=UPI003F49D4BF